MKLTEREFFSFNLKSQTQILGDKGVCLFTSTTDANNEIKAYLLFDFYVKVIVNMNKQITTILLMDEYEFTEFMIEQI